MMLQIDAHQHIWRLARGDYGWLTPSLAPIYRDFTLDDVAPHLAAHGIQATILVQAAPTEAETAFLLQVAARNPVVAGVVGWTNFDAADARIDALAAEPLLVGLRPMVQDMADNDWLLRDQLAPALAAMARHGLVFDALIRPRHLSRVTVLADRHPDLTIVLDHLGKPDIAAGGQDEWRMDFARLAERSNVVCKLSGLVTEARADWTIADLKRYVDHALSCFGPHRLLWGSDWPVVELAGGYARWRQATETLLSELAEEERAAIFGQTAQRVYLNAKGRRKT
jgi:L-fuconolactonase